jgi:glycosyltransferase involved in cell wall biosynthesis
MLRAVRERQRSNPLALHQLEGDSLGNVAPFLPGLNAVFSHHDLSADALGAIYRMSADLNGRSPTAAETREIRFMAAAEERICRASRLILCISDYDRQVLQERFGLRHAVYFPMSVTPERPVARTAVDGETLRLLHIGKVNHLPTFRSLEHILRDVFPRLQPATLDRLQLRVAGKVDEGDPKCRRILALGEPYRKQIVFTGFVQDLAAEYARADVQVVASTEASGLRTRIVESMAWGIPVLSTMVAARGIAGLDPGRNILLADGPEEFAAELDRLARDKNRLLAIAAGGSELYRTRNSRRAVAAELGKRLADFYSL